MIRAAIDPGSRWIAVTITRDDPASPCAFVDAKCFEVGHDITHDPPLVRFRRLMPIDDVPVEGPLLAYEVTTEHVLTEADASRAASEVMAYLLAHHVDEVATEHVRHVHGDGAATALLKSAGVYTRIVDRLEQLGIAVRYVLASTWRARLNPLVKASLLAQGKPAKGVLITRSTGGVLDPVFAEHLAAWPGIATWTKKEAPHILDSTGLALACGLPALPSRTRSPSGPRVSKPRGKGKAPPRGSLGRAFMSDDKLEKARATTRAYQIRTFEGPRREARAAAGCVCKAPGAPGRHKATCPMHKPRVPRPQG